MKKTLLNRYSKIMEHFKSNKNYLFSFSDIFDDSMFIIFAYDLATGEIRAKTVSLNIRLSKKRYKDIESGLLYD